MVSDCGAIGDIYLGHKFAPPRRRGVPRAPSKRAPISTAALEYASAGAGRAPGLITEAEIDTSLRRLLTARFQLGMFDPPEMVNYAQIPYSVNDSPEHRQLALEAARKSIVLLKNEDGMLPLRKCSRPSP